MTAPYLGCPPPTFRPPQRLPPMATGRVPPPTPGQTALYVGDLNPEITEAMIFEELKEVLRLSFPV